MAYSPKEQKAIAYYMKQYNLMPQLSVRPNIDFLDKETGKRTKVPLNSIVTQYEKWKKEDSLEKARTNREKKRKEKLKGGHREQYL